MTLHPAFHDAYRTMTRVKVETVYRGDDGRVLSTHVQTGSVSRSDDVYLLATETTLDPIPLDDDDYRWMTRIIGYETAPGSDRYEIVPFGAAATLSEVVGTHSADDYRRDSAGHLLYPLALLAEGSRS